MQKNLIKFSKRTFAVKNLNSVFSYDKSNANAKTKIGNESFEVKQPLELVLGALSTCEVHSILAQAKQRQVDISKAEVECKGQYDTDTYTEKRKDVPNTYTSVNITAKIQSSEKDKKKLEEAVNKGVQMCPVLNTLKLAGVKINEKIEYI
jgi:uncharacterized OsmC-like protein